MVKNLVLFLKIVVIKKFVKAYLIIKLIGAKINQSHSQKAKSLRKRAKILNVKPKYGIIKLCVKKVIIHFCVEWYDKEKRICLHQFIELLIREKYY